MFLKIRIETYLIIDESIYSSEQCTEQWPNAWLAYKHDYNFLVFVIQYIIPVVVLIFCNARIGYVLYKKKVPGEPMQARDKKMIESKKKVFLLLI